MVAFATSLTVKLWSVRDELFENITNEKKSIPTCDNSAHTHYCLYITRET